MASADNIFGAEGGWYRGPVAGGFSPFSWNPETSDPWNASNLDTDYLRDFNLRSGPGSWAPATDDPFEAAAARQRQAVKPAGGRRQGFATIFPEAMASHMITGILYAIMDAATLPGEAWQGKLDMSDDEAIRKLVPRTANFALTAGLVNAPFRVAAENPLVRPRVTEDTAPVAPLAVIGSKVPTKAEAEAALKAKLPATTEEPGSPLATALQQPVSRRSFMQTAAKVPMVARNVKNLGDVLETVAKPAELAAQPVALPKLNVIEKAGTYNYDDVNNIAQERALADGVRRKDVINGDFDESYHEDAEAELRKKHVYNT